MHFGFGHLVSVMSAIHDKVDQATVEARLKYLQRIPFPAPRDEVGKGGRTYYSADELVKLAVVFELIAASILPAQAASLVNERWPVIAPGLVTAWDERSGGMPPILMLASPNTFASSGGGAGRVEIAAGDELALWLGARRGQGRRMGADVRTPTVDRRATLVDLTALAGVLDGALPHDAQDGNKAAMRRELDGWFETPRPAKRMGV